MSTQSSRRSSVSSDIFPGLCSQGIARLRASCETPVALEALEQRLLLSGLVVDPQADGRDPTTGLLTTDGATTTSASTGADTGVADMSSLINTLLAGDYSAWTQALPSRNGNMINPTTGARQAFTEARNQPIGSDSLYALNPGRVVWTYDPAATHSDAANIAAGKGPWTSYYGTAQGGSGTNGTGPYWWENTYTDQYVIDRMVAQGVMQLTGQTSVAAAWNALFKSFNQYHATGNKTGWESAPGYVAGEGITIKCNLNAEIDQAQTNNQKKNTPQVIAAVLDELVNVCGIPQSDIYVYDDLKAWSRTYWDFYNPSNTTDPHLWSPQTRFPKVNWKDCWDPTYCFGRNPSTMSSDKVNYPWQSGTSPVPDFVVAAKYAVNMSVMSTHDSGGVTLSGKTYIGAIGKSPNLNNGDLGYNNTLLHDHRTPTQMGGQAQTCTAFLANEYLGQKNIIYINDAMYGGWGWGAEVSTPTPWAMRPFGSGKNDGIRGWPSSILMSQDPIALDSVASDFLVTESSTGIHAYNVYSSRPNYDDYLHEGANLGNPASDTVTGNGIRTNYLDPNRNGLHDDHIPSWLYNQGASASLGIHEHWNKADYADISNPSGDAPKQYSRNLGTGLGIELVEITPASAPPAAPTNLLYTVISGSQVNLSWTDNSSNELGFKIERATDSGFTIPTVLGTTTPNVHTFSDTTAAASTSGYYYRVSAINESLASSYATAGPVGTPGDTQPTVPTFLMAQVQSGNQVRLTWTLLDGSDRGIKIERATNAAFTGAVLLTTTTPHANLYTDTTTAAGTAYYYRIQATNGAGVSTNSNTAYAAIGALVAGVNGEMYLYNWGTSVGPTQYADDLILPDFDARAPLYLTPDVILHPAQINYSASNNNAWSGLSSLYSDRYAARFTGYIYVATAGTYTFDLNSGDGSRMVLDGTQIINRNSTGTADTASSAISLGVGYHPFRVDYFNSTSNNILVLNWTGPSIAKQAVPAANLYYASDAGSRWVNNTSNTTLNHWENASYWGGVVPTASTEAILSGNPFYDAPHSQASQGTDASFLSPQPTLYANQSALGLDIRSAGWTVNLNGYTLSLGVGGLQLYGGATPTDKIDTGSGNLIVGYTGASPLKMIAGWIKTGGGTKANARDFDWNGTGGITSSAAAASNAHTALGVRDNGFTLANRGPMSPVDGVSVPTNSVVVRYTWYGDMDLDGEVTVNDYLEFLHYYNENPPPEDISWMTGDFNYDGQINVNDYLLLLDGYASQTGPLGGTVETMSSLSQPTAPAETTPTVVQQVAQAGGTQVLATTDEAAQTQDDAATADLAVLEQGGQSGQATSVLEVAQTPENPDGLGV